MFLFLEGERRMQRKMQRVTVKRGKDREKSEMKLRLLDWGYAPEQCKRTEEEIRRLGEVEEYTAERERLTERLRKILREKQQMELLMESLDAEEREYLRLRFERGYGFTYIAGRLYLSRASLFRMQERILQKLLEEEKAN